MNRVLTRCLLTLVGSAIGLAGGVLLEEGAAVTLVCGAFGGVMALASVIDLQERRIPNWLTYTNLVGAIVLAGAYGVGTLVEAILGAALAGTVMLVFYILARGQLGLGDVKFSVMVGAFVGAAQVPTYLLVGSGLGAIAGLVLLLLGHDRRAAFAYGPFLSIAGLVVMLSAGPVVH